MSSTQAPHADPQARSRPVIIGYDAISPLGHDLDTQWQRAMAGQSGVGELTRFPLRDKFPVRVSGEVDDFDDSPYPFLSPRAMAHWTSPIFRHAMVLVHRTLEGIGLDISEEIAPRVAITFSTAIGGLDALVAADRELVGNERLPRPFMNPNSCINMVGGKLSILTGATGPIVTTITACATGSSSVIAGALFLQSGMADVAICGAVDFPLIEPIVAGFATMNGAYRHKPGHEEEPRRASRPFSVDRRGFVVSEGAGCVVLATERFARQHNLGWQFELAGWHSTSDAHHFVAPNPTTVEQCVRGALEHAGVTPDQVDAVNAHAASTKVGDRVEADVLGRVFEGKAPPTTANKSLIGHCMGASSAIELVWALEGMRRDTLLPTINVSPDPAVDLDLVANEPRPLEHDVVLKNAFGFGGCNACLVLRKGRNT